MENSRRTLALLLVALTCGSIRADDSVSAAFTFDARYPTSGLTPSDWEAHETVGLSERFAAATVMRAADLNGNGIPDAWEDLYGLVGANAAANADPDGDGRTNVQEYNAGTNPILIDDWTKSIAETSEAFETDTRVYYAGGNPTFDVAFAVIKVSNSFICDTGGLYYDWDGDGIPNWWEARFSRTGSKTGLTAYDDDDADGQSNYNEFVAYTNPTNTNSRFVIGLEQIVVAPVKVQSKSPIRLMAAKSLAATPETGIAFALKWQSAVGRTYSVFTSTNLADGWSDKPTAEIEGTGEEIEYVPPQGNASMFFKVAVRLSDNY